MRFHFASYCYCSINLRLINDRIVFISSRLIVKRKVSLVVVRVGGVKMDSSLTNQICILCIELLVLHI